MSRESIEWLNQNVLVGFTEKRGHAWHYREGSDNHYPDAVPVIEVSRRLFNWEAIESAIPCPCQCGEDLKMVSRSDNGHILGVHSAAYSPHGYQPWLLDSVGTILGDELSIGSAGLLRKGAVAWVSVEVPENIKTPEGIEFRPNLLATTSFDGSIATTYKRVVTTVVCDNTRDAALSEGGQQFRVKHTSKSGMRLKDARDALAMVETIADEFTQEIKSLCETKVSVSEWGRFLEAYNAIPAEAGRSQTMAQNKRDALNRLYWNDIRCAPWNGTAYGVVQTVDTYNHHEGTVRNVSRPERNMMNLITGATTSADRDALSVLNTILAA